MIVKAVQTLFYVCFIVIMGKYYFLQQISCVCFGGKFLEAETTEENNFIKAELVTRNTGSK